MKFKSKAAATLLDLVDNICGLQEKVKQVAPLKKRAEEAEKSSNTMKAQLAEALKSYNEIMVKVKGLQDERDDAIRSANEQSEMLRRFGLQLTNSDILTKSLADEYTRWSANVITIGKQITNLIGDVFLSAAALSYYGPFTGSYRDQLVEQWLSKLKSIELPSSDEFLIEDILSNKMEVSGWRICNLPSDKVSLSNACMATNSIRFPIIIDPQELAYMWLKNVGDRMKPLPDDSNNFKAVKHGNKDFFKLIMKAMELGWMILLFDCPEKLDNNVDMLLMQKSNFLGAEPGAVFKVSFDNKEIKVHPNFKL